MTGPRPKGRGRHVASGHRADEWDWEVSLPPAAPGAVPVYAPPETMPTGIDLSELPRTAYAEHLAAGGRPYPSRRALRAAEAAAAGAAGPPGPGFPGAVGVDTRPRPPDGAAPPDGDGVPDDAEASGGPAGDGASSTANVMRSSALMAAGTLVSRILGMVRAAILTIILGTSLTGDAFQVANTLPNNLYILIAGGALNAVLVPQISRAMKQGAAGREYVDRLLSVSLLLLGVASVVLTAAAPALVLLYGKELQGGGAFPLAVAFAFWCLPQVFFYGVYTLLGQVLNARGSFGPYMWAPVVNNVVAIGGMLCFASVMGTGKDLPPPGSWSSWQVTLFAGTATLGVAAQALVLVPVLRRTGFTFRFRWGFKGVGLGTASKVAGWTFAAVAVGQVGYLVASNVAVFGGKEAAAAGKAGAGVLVYGNAYLMFVLPHSLVAVSLVTAIFTRMSRNASDGRRDAVRADLSLGLRTVGAATVLASAAFLVLARDLAFVMFGIPRADAEPIGWVATAMTFGLVAYSAQYLVQRVFYAFEDARTPFVVQTVQTVVWILGNVVARYTLDDIWIVVGAGFALAVSLVVGASMSLLLAGRLLGGVDAGRVVRTHVRLLVGAVLAAIAGWSVKVAVAAYLGTGRMGAAAGLLAAGLVMIGIYAAVLKVLQVRELDDLVAPIVGRLRRG